MLSEIPFEVPPYLLDRIEGMDRVRMAIAGADHPIALKSAHQGADAGLIDPVLVGEADVIRAAASDMDWDITSFAIVDAVGEEKASAAAADRWSAPRSRFVRRQAWGEKFFVMRSAWCGRAGNLFRTSA